MTRYANDMIPPFFLKNLFTCSLIIQTMHGSRDQKILKFLFLVLISAIWLAGCTTIKKKDNLSPSELISKGKREVELKDYDKAEASFKQVLEDYPDSRERVPALLHLANTHFLDREYEEAKFHYKKFIELYPAHKWVDRAHYFKSMCDFRLIEIATRDQTNTHAALEGFEDFMKKFPKSPFYPKAVKRRDETLQTLAQSVFEIGKFYFRTGAYQSAIQRLENVRKDYPVQGFADEAIFLIAESYYKEENYGKAKDTYKELLTKYPKSDFSEDARIRLKALR
ncbi:MAG: outer membrane protein assembly factor BamD [Nitrospinaceae bacterium]|nr:MAG: outer membrane protein assembly factor BamD [Nitrospinaceae bacterium]